MNNFPLSHIIVFATISLCSISIQSQDLIITNEGDSLNCIITNLDTDYIYFTFKHNDEIKSTLLPSGQVKFRQYNYYQTSEVPADKIVGYEICPRYRVAIYGGWSYRVAKLAESVPPELVQYMNGLRPGYHYGMDLSYYLSKQIGFGFKYTYYRAKNEISVVDVQLHNGPTINGKVSEDISIRIIGPYLSTRLLNANMKNSLLMNFGIGYMGYTDKAFIIKNFTMKGGTVGFSWDIGYDIGLSENFAIGFQFSFIAGILTQYELSDGITSETIKLEKEDYEGLSRIDLSIGLRLIK